MSLENVSVEREDVFTEHEQTDFFNKGSNVAFAIQQIFFRKKLEEILSYGSIVILYQQILI